MKTHLARFSLLAAIVATFTVLLVLTGCVATGPRAGGDAASRSNGNTTVNIEYVIQGGSDQPATGGPVTVHVTGNTNMQDAGKAVEALKGSASSAVTGTGTASSTGGTVDQSEPDQPVSSAADTPPAEDPRDIENRALRKRVADLESARVPTPQPDPAPPVGDEEGE